MRGGKGGVSRKSSLGSRAEALPTPATRGLQAPRLGLCRLALEFPSSHDQIPTNEKLGPGPEEEEGKAEQGGKGGLPPQTRQMEVYTRAAAVGRP